MATTSETQKDGYNAKPPMFDGQRFEYWKDRLESFFLGFDADLWDIIVDGYERPVDEEGKKISRSEMTAEQKKLYSQHHKARAILLSAISYEEHQKITDREFAKGIFESLKMSHEGDKKVKESKALSLIQKYESFIMEPNESIEEMFS